MLCWAVNHRDSSSSQVEASSDSVIFFAEGLTLDQVQNAELAIVQLQAKLQAMGVETGPLLATTGTGLLATLAAVAA